MFNNLKYLYRSQYFYQNSIMKKDFYFLRYKFVHNFKLAILQVVSKMTSPFILLKS